MNADQLKGKWMQFKGELKQHWGKLLDDDVQQHEGSYDKAVGLLQERFGGHCASLVQERYGEAKQELISWAGKWQQGPESEAAKDRTH